jgi:hypothetical protein
MSMLMWCAWLAESWQGGAADLFGHSAPRIFNITLVIQQREVFGTAIQILTEILKEHERSSIQFSGLRHISNDLPNP